MELKKIVPWNWFRNEDQELAAGPGGVKREAARHPVVQLQREMDRLFTDFFRGFPSFPHLQGFGIGSDSWLRPTMDVAAGEKEYTLSVELPGVERDDIHLELVNDTLRISGEKKQEKEEKEKDFYRMERSYGSFQRVLSLPDDADRDGIMAAFDKGVMKITIPRKPRADSSGRKIDIKTG